MSTKTQKIRHRKQRLKQLLSIGILCLFLSYFAGETLFTHVHTVNGVSIVHSHPFTNNNSGTSSSSHSHSADQIRTLQHLSYLIFVVVAACIFKKYISVLYGIVFTRLIQTQTKKGTHNFQRGPPLFS